MPWGKGSFSLRNWALVMRNCLFRGVARIVDAASHASVSFALVKMCYAAM